jgi:hypothetical protein
VISELAVADDLIVGRLVEIHIPELDLRRTLRAIWDGAANPPAGVARELVAHILNRHLRGQARSRTPRPAERPEKQPPQAEPASQA